VQNFFRAIELLLQNAMKRLSVSFLNLTVLVDFSDFIDECMLTVAEVC